MRGGIGDPYDPNGSGPPEPNSFVVVVWASVAGLALLLAMVAMLYGSPDRNRTAEDAAVDMTPTGAIDPTAERIGIFPDEGGRGDFGASGGTDVVASRTPTADLARLEVENAALRQTVASLRSQIDGLSERLDTVERRFGELTGSLGTRPMTTPTISLRPPPPDPMPTGTTGLVSDAPRAKVTEFGVELGSYPDLQAVKAAWRKLLDTQPDLFAELDALATVRDRAGATELLLVAGPFPNAQDAAAKCTEVERAGLACLPAFYLGQPLMIR